MERGEYQKWNSDWDTGIKDALKRGLLIVKSRWQYSQYKAVWHIEKEIHIEINRV